MISNLSHLGLLAILFHEPRLYLRLLAMLFQELWIYSHRRTIPSASFHYDSIMSALEQPFIDAINAGQIEGVLIEGRTKSGKKYSKAIGNRTLPDGQKKPLSSSDLLFLASATKFLTTIAALQLCENGQLSLDADLSSQLAGLKNMGVLADWDETTNSPKTEPLRKSITLRHLLTHSSGLVYEFGVVPKMQKWRAANPKSEDALGIEAHYTTPLAFQPGEGWMYGTGIDWVGHLVERASGFTLDEYIRQHILKPVGVGSTGFSFFPVKEGLGDRMPDLNPKDPEGLGLSAAMGHNPHGDIKSGVCYGGAGGYGTAEAYIVVLQSLLANDGKIINQDSLREMLSPQLEEKAKESLTTLLEGEWAPYFNMGTTSRNRDFGLGGLLVTEDGDESGIGKGTLQWGGGANSSWFIDPQNGICGFASPQLGLPSDPAKGLELKAVFKKHLKDELGV